MGHTREAVSCSCVSELSLSSSVSSYVLDPLRYDIQFCAGLT